jgi:N-acylneuraminate cytidylyltransferase
MRSIAIIPARGGSVRIPRKNIRPFHGKPIIAYSIAAAYESKLFNDVIVSTDDDEIAEVAMKYGAHIFRRPQDDGNTGTQEVTRAAIHRIPCDIACCIYATAPLLTSQELVTARNLLNITGKPYVYLDAYYYMGKSEDFLNNVPLIKGYKMNHPHNWVDINTEEDWQKAEELYRR